MNDTQTQIERLIELAIVQRSELKQLISELPQLREHLNAEIERTFEEAEPQIRTELEEFCRARATDEHAKTGAALAAKVEELSKQLEVTTAAKYSVLMAERAENANLLAKAEARIEDAASMLSHAVKEIVTDELSRFPRAGEIDQLRKEFAEPRGLNPRGRWMPDETYQRLDLVTINGDSFVSNIDGNRERPSRTAGDWTLSAARGNGGGGGGVTTMTDLVPVPSNGQLLIGNGSGFVNSTLTAGTGISISNGPGSITINATDGNITLDDGTAAAPALNFTNEPTTGLFRASTNVMGFAVAGTSRATMTATGMTVTGTITPTGSVHAAAGSVGNPSLAFNSDQDTGLFSIGANNIGLAVGGAKVLDVASTGLTVTGALGATSLTSPASTNLTLGTADFGTALTVASATGKIGIGTTSPSDKFVVSNGGAQGLEIGATSLVIAQAYNRSGSAYVDYRDQCLNRIFYTNGSTEALTLSSTQAATFAGAVSVATGAAVGGATAGAGGLAFPATAVAVANANTLDDYEEGTWTPALYYQNATGVTRTYTAQDGGYTKIGNTVTVWCFISGATSNSGSYANDNIGISGLPFATVAVGNATPIGPVIQSGFSGSATVGTVCGLCAGSTALFIQTSSTTGNLADDFGAGATYSLYFTATYGT